MENTIALLNTTLNKLVNLYAESDSLFIEAYNKLSESIKEDIKLLYKTHNLVKTKYSELPDIAGEVLFYVDMYDPSKVSKIRSTSTFTLRNVDDLMIFTDFLDKMLTLQKLSPYHFVEIFPKSPRVLWDKVDDLRETSFKVGKESKKYTACLLKSRTLSFGFAKLAGVSTNQYE